MRHISVGETELALAINTREDVALDAIRESDHRIGFDEASGVPRATELFPHFPLLFQDEPACFSPE